MGPRRKLVPFFPDGAVTFGDGPRRRSTSRGHPQRIATGIPPGSWTETTMAPRPSPLRCAVVGRGRMGFALSVALGAGEPLGRGARSATAGADIVLLAVPDGEIAAAAAAVAPGPLVGHLSGATTLAPLAPHEAFSLHPLMTVTGPEAPFAGATAAIAGVSEASLTVARRLAEGLGMRPVEV